MTRPKRAAAIAANTKNTEIASQSNNNKRKLDGNNNNNDQENEDDWEDEDDMDGYEVVNTSLSALGLSADILAQEKKRLEAMLDNFRKEFEKKSQMYEHTKLRYDNIIRELDRIRQITSDPNYNSGAIQDIDYDAYDSEEQQKHSITKKSGHSKGGNDDADQEVIKSRRISDSMVEKIHKIMNGDTSTSNKKGREVRLGVNAGPLEGHKISLLLDLRKTRKEIVKMEDRMLDSQAQLSSAENLYENMFPNGAANINKDEDAVNGNADDNDSDYNE
ncbi:hypothetical protein H4219_002643 [Mycoemilia scoparia]|uniref:Uncharacterized protein n=1 Tax=Mycoemilia scoparia TaxID=417184 RepID=A0A9W8DNU9_9FUNG|nr:hypothetical protein H4219_002643 [Mycoemilia scoparia]